MPTILRPNNDNDPATWDYSANDTHTFTGVAAGSYQIGHVVWATAETVTADSTAPVQSSPTAAADGTDGYTGSVSTDTGSGTLYFAAIPTAGATPSAAQVKAGTGGDIIDASAGSQAVSGTGVQNVSGAGLSASTAYKLVFAHEDAAITPNISTVSVSAEFTTDAAVVDLLGGEGLFSAAGNWSTSGSMVIGSGVLTKTAGTAGTCILNVASLLTPGTTVKIEFDVTSWTAGGPRVYLNGATDEATQNQTSVGHLEENLLVPELETGALLLEIRRINNADAWVMDNLIITLVP